MAELGLVCNVVELSNATISIIKQLLQAYDTLKKLPKQLEDNKRKLNELLETLEVVKDTKVLQTDRIADQVKTISETAGDVQARLNQTQKLQQKRVSRRYLRILLSGTSDDKELFVLFQRLDSAREELALRIQIIHVTITGSMSETIATTTTQEQSRQPNTVMETADRRRHKGNNNLEKRGAGRAGEESNTQNSGHKYGKTTTENTMHLQGDEKALLQDGSHYSNSGGQHTYDSTEAKGGALHQGDKYGGKSFFEMVKPDPKQV